MSCVLVTGAAGFVGGHLLELLEQEPTPVVALLRPNTEPLVAGSRVIWHSVELLDREAVTAAIATFQPTEIYHLAGAAHVGDSWAHTYDTFAGNVLGTHHLFEAVRHARIRPRVLITSSAFVYAPLDRAISESDVVRPNSPYGTSKVAQEMVAKRAWEDDGIPALIARSFNHIGPRQSPTFVASSIAKQIAEIETGRRAPALTLGNLASQRDIMDVRDTVRAYRAMMALAHPGIPYNVCSGEAVPVKTLVDLLVSKARVPVEIKQDPALFRPNDTRLIVGHSGRLARDTGWAPLISLEQTVEDLLGYWRAATA